MAGVNNDNVGLTLIRYLDKIDKSLPMVSKMRQRVKNETVWGAEHLEWRVHVTPSGAVSWIQDGGKFPVPNKQGYATAKAYRRSVAGKIQLTDHVLANAGEGKTVAKSVLKSEMEGLLKEIAKTESYFMHGDGSGVVSVAMGSSSNSGTDSTVKISDARLIWPGVSYDVYDSTLTTHKGTIRVIDAAQDVDASGYATLTYAGQTVSIATTDRLVWKDSLNNVISGLDALITDSGTLQNISAAQYPRFTSFIADAGGTPRNLTPELFRKFQAAMYQKTQQVNAGSVWTVLGSAGQMMNLDELYEKEIRITPDTKKIGPATPVFQSSFGSFRLETDVDAKRGEIAFVDFSQIYRGVQKKLHWRQAPNGGGILRPSDTSAHFVATCIEMCQLYIRERITSGKLKDLNESVVIAY